MRRVILKLFRRWKLEEDLEAELAFHREQAAADGNPIPLGNAAAIREFSRDAWRFVAIEDTWRDLVSAVRRLWHSPGFTLTVVLTLALGIGANTAIFTIADGVLFRPLPFDAEHRVFALHIFNRQSGSRVASVPLEAIDTRRGRLPPQQPRYRLTARQTRPPNPTI